MADRVITMQIDTALSRYYTKKGVNYYNEHGIGIFIAWCDENGLEDDTTVAAEFEVNDPQQSLLVDFDDNFPGIDNEQDKPAAILRILKKAYTNQNEEHICTKEHWNINETDIKNTIQIHKQQCPVLLDEKFAGDQALLKVLAVGTRTRIPYLLYLIDMMQREKSDHINIPRMHDIWPHSNKHLKYLKTIGNGTPYDAVIKARPSFNRIAPPLMLSPSNVIVESLEKISEYIEAAVAFVANVAAEGKKSCPFQFDAVFAFNKVIKVKPMDNRQQNTIDDDDDDDEEEEKDPFYDCFGAVKKKLNAAKLHHLRGEVDYDHPTNINIPQRILKVNFKEFQRKQPNDYPRRRRFCAFIDRRQPDDADNKDKEITENDEVILFDPPSDCNTFPKGEVQPLFYFNSSRTCIIPRFGYNDSKHQDNSTDEQEKGVKEKELKKTINASSSCNGAMMMLSFHVESTDEIRCYLYLNGQCMRFFPQDIKNVLPQFFDPEYDENSAFASSKEATILVNTMKPNLRDNKFIRFYEQYKSSDQDIQQAQRIIKNSP